MLALAQAPYAPVIASTPEGCATLQECRSSGGRFLMYGACSDLVEAASGINVGAGVVHYFDRTTGHLVASDWGCYRKPSLPWCKNFAAVSETFNSCLKQSPTVTSGPERLALQRYAGDKFLLKNAPSGFAQRTCGNLSFIESQIPGRASPPTVGPRIFANDGALFVYERDRGELLGVCGGACFPRDNIAHPWCEGRCPSLITHWNQCRRDAG